MAAERPGIGQWTSSERAKVAGQPALAGAAAVVLLALLLLPQASAGVVPAATTKGPPFTTATVTLSNPSSHAGSGITVLVTSAFFNRTTGIGGFSDNASAVWKTGSRNNSALAEGKIQVNLPVTIPTTGIHSISVVWVTVATGSVNLTRGTCTGAAGNASTSCTRFAQAFVNGFAILLDRTNSTSLRVQNWPGNHTSVWTNTSCSFLVCTSSSSTTFSSALHTGHAFWSWDWTSVSLVSTHKYVIEMFLFGGAQVTLVDKGATLTGAGGNAQFNSGTLRNDEVLKSVTVT